VVACYSVVGALIMLCLYDWVLAPLCLGLMLPAYLVNSVYSRKTLALSGRLHDEFEREVDVIQGGQPAEVRGHYGAVAGWRIKLADWEALNFGLMELFVLALLAVTLLRSCSATSSPGDIFAVFRYVLMFVMALDNVPLLVRQISRIRDIHRRLQPA
jgi:ABC-type multidrug transport system fused ATPase/permease subunit